MSASEEYHAALQRIIQNKPINIAKGSSINKDTVALEAGRKRGSIKKSRAEHSKIISEIEIAAKNTATQAKPSPIQEIKKHKIQKKSALLKFEQLKMDYELALAKIVSLEYENHTLKLKIKTLNDTAGKTPNTIDFPNI
ncbi:hypothetical protein [Pseudomonas sp. CES]|uniref:hypothetical protein n=1 Tax=Pseudomonas sp. CES TaxID=2719586 RepID=UPI001470690D|nr:hypothetical protein [Pseudomonas sp. CES]KAF4558717.1 hypothetical protein HBJ16_003708 [Pseudomonas sp. CES]